MSISLVSIKDHLLPGLMQIQGKYDELPAEYEGVFERRHSTLALERAVTDRFMSPAVLKSEGGVTHFDNDAGQRYVWNMEPVEVGLGYSITRKAIDDNLYKDAFQPTNLNLQLSFKTFWNIQAAYIFNAASTTNAALGGDGTSLLSTLHRYDGGYWANTPTTQVDLNESSLIAAQKAIRKNFVDEAGILIDAHAEQLLVPVDLEDVAIRLLKTELRPGTANNDVNAILSMAGVGVPKGYKVMRYFTSPYAWFMKTNVKGLIHLVRIPFEMDMHVEFVTDNLLVKAYERGGFFYSDPRCVYGNMPTS